MQVSDYFFSPMASNARVFLFSGPDSYASLAAVRRWEALFRAKHGDASRYVLEADELGPDRLAAESERLLAGDTLFSTSKFILIRRAASADPGPGFRTAKALLDVLEKSRSRIDGQVTIVLWEPVGLATNHPVSSRFAAWGATGWAEARSFAVPTSRTVVRVAQDYLREAGTRMDAQAVEWLRAHYLNQEQEARIRQRLKPGQELLQDNRTWWLYGVLEGALLRAEHDEVGLADLSAGSEGLAVLPGPFALADAVERQNWPEAWRQASLLAASGPSDGDYFSLYAALAWQARRAAGPLAVRSHHAKRLLGEIELLAKNVDLPHAWLVDMFLLRLAAAESDPRPIIDPKRLWTALASRSF